jgi:predicted glycogen debranching enzyme
MGIDKMLMQDLAYATSREYLVTSHGGAYAAGTISGCNTRKYHGLLVAPQPQLDGDDHVLLSALDETVSYDNKEYLLAVRRYPGQYQPDGHSLIAAFAANPVPCWTFKTGDAVIVKELLMDEPENRVVIQYTLKEGPSSVSLRLQPFVAFRNMHTVGKANSYANLSVNIVDKGIQMRLYASYDDLFMQVKGDSAFTNNGYWYYNTEYAVEKERGYESHEDLYSPGYFDVTLTKEQPVVFAAGLSPDKIFSFKLRPSANTMKERLLKAAKQFIINTEQGVAIRAGYYWFGSWGRDTCIALPGLTLLTDNVPVFGLVVKTLEAGLKDGLLSNAGIGKHALYNTVDASLWFVWSLQQYNVKIWATYKEALSSILYNYRQGTMFGIKMLDNGLITAGEEGVALTWMDAVIGGVPVTPRRGMVVEINALWYNAVCFCLEAARNEGDDAFVKEWEALPAKIAASFVAVFWDEEKQYLADVENDWSVRPNQIFAVSLPFTPLKPDMQKAVVDKVRNELLTPRGLRTLSPLDDRYRGHYDGDQLSRDHAYHQGTVWPWLLAHFAAAYLRTDKAEALPVLEELYEGMSATLDECCLHSVPEVFEGNFPYKAGGAVAQAWSVAELIRMEHIISTFKRPVS